MPRCCHLVLPFVVASLAAQAPEPNRYVPPRGNWALRTPAELGLDAERLAQAVAVGQRENGAPRDGVAFQRASFGSEPHGEAIGPLFDRGGTAGVIVKDGYLVAQWGDVLRADMCNSVTKTFLTALVGLALEQGHVRDVHERVAASMPPGVDLFASEHNRPITWDHLVRQTSDWQGTLWGKPDWADRPEGASAADWPQVPRHVPGSHYEYNDVRVNVLALALLHVVRRPLPTVLREAVMEPIGASSTWRWHGYDNAWLELDGQRLQSVSGGGHWGGGLVIDSLDLARFGLLCARDGRWGERQVLPSAWLALARTPGEHNRGYGHANWFLNTDRKALPDAPADAVWFAGNGGNFVYVDRAHDLVAVLRWVRNDALAPFTAALTAALPAGTSAAAK